MSNLTLGSLFDGSGGFPLGGLISGITPVWASEIEPFPIRVTTKRMPFMKHYGDISAMDGAKIEPVDIICFGSPCQDMSVAGRRDGLDGSRSSLFYEAIRIIKEMRNATNGRYPRYIVWENVPGAFSSNGGADFKAVLEAVIGIVEPSTEVPSPDKNKWPYADCYVGNGWSVAYRTLDAQYWGVPQRRKRIYLVADFDSGSAGEILFKSEGLSGYSAESFRAWQRTASNFGASSAETGIGLIDSIAGNAESYEIADKAHALKATHYKNPPALVFENHSQDSRYTGPLDTAQTVLSTFGTGGNNQPFVVEPPVTMKIRCGCEGGGKGPLLQTDKSATLSCNNDQTLFAPKSLDCRNLNANDEVSGTLQAKANGGHSLNYINPVVYGISAKDSNAMKSGNPHSGIYEAETSRTIDANGGNPSCNQGGMAVVEGNGSRPSHKGDGYAEADIMYTLNATEVHAVAYDENPVYSSSKASYFTEASENVANTLVATDYKDPPLVNDKPCGFYPQMKAESMAVAEDKSGCLVNGTNPGYQNGVIDCGYTVRRLTPTECARLQGFPDWWCASLGEEDPSTDELRFWLKVFETHSRITGASKPKNLKQVRTWLAEPYTDSAEYKMWGNGVALPCVYFVLSGIAWAAEKSADICEN